MKKIVTFALLVGSFAFCQDEVINKENILNQLEELQKARAEQMRDLNSPEAINAALKEKEEEKQKIQNKEKLNSLKATISSIDTSGDIMVPRHKFSYVKINNTETFYAFEKDLKELIADKKDNDEKSEKIRVLRAKLNSIPETDANGIQNISNDIDSLLQSTGGMFNSVVMNENVIQQSSIELKAGDVFNGYRVENRNGTMYLVRL